ncbi:MAG: hypothetical protein AUK51_11620 [Comamonadaceae bacterium CG2_30_59_20]|nr:MAG: hypothetical protein AUK51_11620 [Comamonadaceae bacterium CG2_30_59_20]
MVPSMLRQHHQALAALTAGAFVVLTSLFFGVSSLLHFQEAQSAWELHNAHATAVAKSLSDFNHLAGYGGFIHNFKNLVLRRDLPRYQKHIEANIVGLRAQLDQLAALLPDEKDKAALGQIRSTFEVHISDYAKVLQMLAAGARSDELDAVAKVDDGPALNALAQLSTSIAMHAADTRQLAQSTYADAMRYAWIGGALVLMAISAAVLAMVMFLRSIIAANDIIRKTQAKMAEREAQLGTTQRIAHLGGWKSDLESGRLFWTEETFRICGLPVTAQVSVDDALQYYLPESRERLKRAIKTAIEDAKPFDLELQIKTTQGDVRWVRTQGEVWREGAEPGVISGTFQDITEDKQADIALRAAHDIFERSAVVAFLWRNEENWPVEFVSNNVTTLFGYTAEELTSGSVVYSRLIHPDDISTVEQEVAYFSSSAAEKNFTHRPYRITTKGGEVKWIRDDTAIRRDAEGNITHYQGVIIDVTESKLAKEQLQLAASVFAHTREGITITDTQGTILDVNDAFTEITGYSREDIIGLNPRILSSGRHEAAFYKAMWDALTARGHWSGEIWNRNKNGEVIAELLTISAIRDGHGTTQQYVGLFSDITERKAHESQLEHLAHFDALTNLPNRVLLADRLHQAIAQTQRRQQHLAVAYLDLDGFKAINDRHGHKTGDQLLITLARRLKEALREVDTVARVGGDEFVAVLADLEGPTASVPLINRMLAAAALPVQVGNLSLQVSASLGVTYYPQAQDTDAEQLLRQADQAMYRAKVAGKNRYCVFDAAQDGSIHNHHEEA